MPDAIYYRQWLINCFQNIVYGVEPTILERTPYGNLSEAYDYYESLDYAEQGNFIEGLRRIVVGGDDVSIFAQSLAIDFAETENIWGIEPEVRILDSHLPEQWDYDKLNPPENTLEIDLRGAVNIFLDSYAEHRMRI